MASKNYTLFTSGSKNINEEWLTADLVVRGGNSELDLLRFEIFPASACSVEITYNSGTNWAAINNGTPLDANKIYNFETIIKGGDQINFRQTTGTVTINRCVGFSVD